MNLPTFQPGDMPEDQHGRIEINMRARANGKTARIAVYNEILPVIKKAIENGDFVFTSSKSIRVYNDKVTPLIEPKLFDPHVIEISWYA